MDDRTSVIAFFSAENLFRKKSAEKQRECFDSLSDAFKAEFDRDLTENDWQMLVEYQAERADIKRKREQARIEREAAKAAKLEAMPIAGGQDTADEHIARYPAGRYVLTVAQNNTKVDKDFLAALHVYCRENGATLIVGKMLYNKKAFRQPGLEEGEELWFDPAVKEYLVEGHLDLGGMHFIADANVLPTAKWPTSGFSGVTPPGINAIIPASRIELRVSAALKGAKTKVIASTGAVTKRNYILRKTGTIAAFNHSIGAIFIDTESNELRHLEQIDGCKGFYDLHNYYSPSGVEVKSGIAALQFGDIHAEKMEQVNLDRALGLIREYEPNNIVLHDVLDFSSRNHHNIKDPVFIHRQHVAGNTVRGDLEKLASVLDDIASAGRNSKIHIVESNHDLAINTWLKSADFKIDPVNATVYLRCMLAQYEHNESGDGGYFNMLEFAYEEIGDGRKAYAINFHETDCSLVIAGVEMGNHGHNGINGSRGSPKQFAELGVPMNTGHTHSPSIYGPVYTAGVTASLDMDYNKGASSWAIADVVTYENGQRQIWFS